jgi:hypothetical protein
MSHKGIEGILKIPETSDFYPKNPKYSFMPTLDFEG